MSKNPKSLTDRLILLVARLGERATVQNITGRHLVGAEIAQARRDAVAFVVWESVYQMRRRRPGWAPQLSRKPSTTAKLTKAGIWRAAALGVPYSPGLVDALIAESEKPARHSRAEKQREAETAALVADGHEYRRQNAARKTAKDEAAKAALVGPRRKRSARHYEKLNKFLVSRGMQPTKVSAFGNGVALRQPDAKIPSPVPVAPVTRPTAGDQHIPGTAPVVQDFAWAVRESQQNFGQPTRTVRNAPKHADAADDARILALFRNDPYGGELLPNGKIRYDNRDWTLQGWEKERFKQAG
jgi:hypothetical protein